MGQDELLARNIGNMLTLWSAMGAEKTPDGAPAAFHISSSWPHRCWLPLETSLAEITALAENLATVPTRAIVPVLPWPVGGGDLLTGALLAHQFKLRAELQAMVFELDGLGVPALPALDIRWVETAAELDRWTEVCSEAFGYMIDGTVIHRLSHAPGARFLLVYSEGAPAATALTLHTGDTIGIHQIGVPPAFRGRGIARDMMQHVMGACQASGARYATLQASAAAVGIYRKIGFESQFTIRTYRRDQPA